MKRSSFAFMILLLMSSAASAKWISFGAKAGLYTANTTERPAGWSTSSFRNGFAGGIYLTYPLNDYLGLQPEALYAMKGLEGVAANPARTMDFTANFSYLEIPLLAKVTVRRKSDFSPYVFAGPRLAINLAADVEIEAKDPGAHEDLAGSIDYSGVMKKAELGFVLGAGCGLTAGLGKITFDARFDFGLSNVYSGGEVTGEIGGRKYDNFVWAGESKNIGFALLLGYCF